MITYSFPGLEYDVELSKGLNTIVKTMPTKHVKDKI